MKAQITIGIALVLAVMVGGLSMGCIDAPEPVIVEPVVVIVPEVLPEEFEGTEEFNSTIVVIELVIVEVVEEVKVYPTLVCSGCYVEYPDNVAGFDTPCERAAMLQAELNSKLDMVYNGEVIQQRYQYRGEQAFIEFYVELYQDKLDKYTKLYCGLGNRILTDSNDPIIKDVGAFNFTSPWGARNLGNGSFVYDTYQGKVSFIGEETASGRAVQVNSTGAIIGDMFYTYLGNNATLSGNTEVSF